MKLTYISRWLIAIHVITIILLVAGGAWFYRTQERDLRQHAADELQAIAQLKVDQISTWRAERLADAAVLSENSSYQRKRSAVVGRPAGREHRELTGSVPRYAKTLRLF